MHRHTSLPLLFLANIFALPCRGYFGDEYKVLLSYSKESKIGEETAFEAVVVRKPGAESRHLGYTENTIYEFSWKVSDLEWIRQKQTTLRWKSFRWRWFSEGQKTVSVSVKILVGTEYNHRYSSNRKRSGYREYCARNSTQVTVLETKEKIFASLEAYQNSSQNKNPFTAGTVNLAVRVHSPGRFHNLSYNWWFGDRTKLLNSRLSEVSHNFTTVEACTVKVVIHGFHNGEYCSGVATKDLLFKANVTAHLVIVGLPGPKLPSDQEKVAINVPARFEVKFKDPFKAVTNVSTDWDFGDGSLVTERNSCLIFHTYQAKNEYHVWVTVRVETRYYKDTTKLLPISKNIFVEAPVSLKVQHNNITKDKPVAFHISCNGSLPVSFHWCVSRHCNELHQRNCSPTLEHNDSCYLIVNHTFHNSGNFCVSVGVRNDVSNTNTSLVLQIPDDAYPINSAKRRSKDKLATGAVIAISAMCLFLVVPIVLLVRRWNHSKRDKTEKANFDFRDSNDISFSSVQLFERPCFPWCGNRTSINAEGVPLCDHAAGNKLYTL